MPTSDRDFTLACGTSLSDVKVNQRIYGNGGDIFDDNQYRHVIAEVVGRDYLLLRDTETDYPFMVHPDDFWYCFTEIQEEWNYTDRS